MKRLQLKKIVKFRRSNYPITQKILLPMLFILLISGFQTIAQPALPVLTVRFTNPYFDCPTQNYCLDVEFLSDTEGLQLFGMNVRFFYDDNILEFLSLGDFATGYNDPVDPEILTGPPGSGSDFGVAGPLEWFNGSVQLVSASPVYLSTTEWTKLFNVCFHVDDPASISLEEFCPTIIWDLQLNRPLPAGREGFLPGDDGVVMTVVDPGPNDSSPTTEQVVQFNWEYDLTGSTIGYPVSDICTSTICGYIIPLSNWALFLAIGLMFVATIFFYRRRISG